MSRHLVVLISGRLCIIFIEWLSVCFGWVGKLSSLLLEEQDTSETILPCVESLRIASNVFYPIWMHSLLLGKQTCPVVLSRSACLSPFCGIHVFQRIDSTITFSRVIHCGREAFQRQLLKPVQTDAPGDISSYWRQLGHQQFWPMSTPLCSKQP